MSIEINVTVENNLMLLIEIRDNGAGINSQTLSTLQEALEDESDNPIVASQNGLGLENVHKRLQLHYGKGSGLSIDSIPGAYTCVTIRLPWEQVNLGDGKS